MLGNSSSARTTRQPPGHRDHGPGNRTAEAASGAAAQTTDPGSIARAGASSWRSHFTPAGPRLARGPSRRASVRRSAGVAGGRRLPAGSGGLRDTLPAHGSSGWGVSGLGACRGSGACAGPSPPPAVGRRAGGDRPAKESSHERSQETPPGQRDPAAREAAAQGLRAGAAQAACRAGQAPGMGQAQGPQGLHRLRGRATAPARAAPSRRSPSASARASSASSPCPRRPSARSPRCTSSATCRTCPRPARS